MPSALDGAVVGETGADVSEVDVAAGREGDASGAVPLEGDGVCFDEHESPTSTGSVSMASEATKLWPDTNMMLGFLAPARRRDAGSTEAAPSVACRSSPGSKGRRGAVHGFARAPEPAIRICSAVVAVGVVRAGSCQLLPVRLTQRPISGRGSIAERSSGYRTASVPTR